MNSHFPSLSQASPALSAASSRELAPSLGWVVMVTTVFVLFTVPYTANIIPWAHREGFFPLRPAFYLLAMSVAVIGCTLGRKPDFTLTTLLIIVFHAIYLFDAAVLRRFDHPSGSNYAMMTHGAVLLTTIAMAWFIGAIHSVTWIPVMASASMTVVVCSLVNIAEWFGVHSFTIVMGRAAGFWGDPNNSSIAIVVALAIFLTLNKNIWVSFGLIALSFVAVAITLSRSGIIAELLVVIAYLVLASRRNPRAVTQALAVTIPVVIAATVFLVSNMSSDVLREADVQDRLGALLGKDTGKMASGERMKDLNDGLQAVRLKPVTGYGIGAGTTKWQPHNQIVATWIDGGIAVAFAYLAILGLLTFKCIASGLHGGLCLLTLFIFIPFSQILHTHMGYWMAAIVLVTITSSRFYSVQWFKQSTPLPKI
ncbi:MAG: O-antigen ligase family protein [Akkermansiaceae bacterium]